MEYKMDGYVEEKLMTKTYKRYYLRNLIRNRINRNLNWITEPLGKSNVFNRKHYCNRKFLSMMEANNKISYYINSGKPFLVARFGNTESNMMRAHFERPIWRDDTKYSAAVALLCETAGFFPNDSGLAERFVEEMLKISPQIDLLGVWNNHMEDFICEKYVYNADYTRLRYLEPYYYEEAPWSASLEGKKVLVIHPFEQSIRLQYGKRREIWKDRKILPDFELKTLKAVQTMADQTDDRFATWFDALEYMIEECKKIEFDIALIGCGAYGLPLAAEIKKMGKGAIHLGGALQILFGIKGNRWDSHPIISKFYNDAWIRPIDEKPAGCDKVEESCYW